DRPKPLLRVSDPASRRDHLFLECVQPETHYLKEQSPLSGDVVIEPGLCYPHRLGDVVHRSGIVAFLANDSRGLAVDLGQPVRLAVRGLAERICLYHPHRVFVTRRRSQSGVARAFVASYTGDSRAVEVDGWPVATEFATECG